MHKLIFISNLFYLHVLYYISRRNTNVSTILFNVFDDSSTGSYRYF